MVSSVRTYTKAERRGVSAPRRPFHNRPSMKGPVMANSHATPTHNPIQVGDKFGHWTVLSYAGSRSGKHPEWTCACRCGVVRKVLSQSLKRGASQSCGCQIGPKCVRRNTTHGMSGTREYKAWFAMLDRCRNPGNTHYDRYGGRGISVCSRWESYEAFVEDMGERPPGMTIDRVDNDGHYEPGNCRWATRRQQQNNRHDNHVLVVDGVKATLSEWSAMTGIKFATLRGRIRRGWSAARAVKTPVGKWVRRNA